MDIEPAQIERLQGWLLSQPHGMATVTTASDALKLPATVIRQIAAEAYWICLEVHDGIEHLALDGE